jgi:hypothetical protein
MQVAQLLDALLLGEDVEVVVAGLPEVGTVAFEEFGGLALEDAKGGGERAMFGLGEEKVDVLRHEDVAEEIEPMFLPKTFEGLLEDDAGMVFEEVRETTVTTEGEEVLVAFGLVPLQVAGHEVIVTSIGVHPTHAR